MAEKNSERSAIRSPPVIRRSTEETTAKPRPAIRAPKPVGLMNSRIARPSMNCVTRRGASRKSSALREGGVSRTSRSKPSSSSSS